MPPPDRTPGRLVLLCAILGIGALLLGPGGPSALPGSAAATGPREPARAGDALSPKPLANHTVTFTEAGLPSGTRWSAGLSGARNATGVSSTTPTISISVADGYYTCSASGPAGWSVELSATSVNVNGADINLSVNFTKVYHVTFREAGLASSTIWSVTLNGTPSTYLNATSVWFTEPNGSYSYAIAPIAGYGSNVTSGTVSVSGGDRNLSVGFTPTRGNYYVVFQETGLAPGGYWNVTINGSARGAVASEILFVEPNGTYAFLVDPYLEGYTITPPSGTVTVAGSNVSAVVTFVGRTYVVTFQESGLPIGTPWWVNITGGPSGRSTTTNLSFSTGLGTYEYEVGSADGFVATPASGTFVVSGENLMIGLEFSLRYPVTFAETGVWAGEPWWVTLGGFSANTTGSSISFPEVNGSYAYSVESVTGLAAHPASGTVTVNGAGVTVNVTFTEVTYPVTFTETGLPAGANWSVSVGPPMGFAPWTVNWSVGTTISFRQPIGEFTFEVTGPYGYGPDPSYGVPAENGTALDIPVRFSVLPSYPVDFLDPGMPSGTSWWVNLTTVPSDAAAYSATNSTSAASIGFSVVNGTYDWTAGASVNGTTVEASGSVWVGGNRTSVHVTFPNVPALPTLTFEASGLPRGTNWSVTLTSPAGEFRIEATLTRWSDGASTVSFRVSPGTYAFSISAPGYTRASGNVTVSGTAPTSVPVSFQPLGSVGPGASGLPVPAWAAWIGVAFLVLGASGLGLTVYRSRARERAMGSALAARLFDTEWTRDGDGEPEPRTDR